MFTVNYGHPLEPLDFNGSADFAGYKVFRTQREAGDFAVARGWKRRDAQRFQSRFNAGWIVGHCWGTDTFRVLTDDSWLDVPLEKNIDSCLR